MDSEINKAKYDTGVIHGRFQILHNDHLKYLLAGKALCNHLVVGITNPDPSLTRKDSADPERDSPINNPLTYYERYVLINAALREAGLTPDQFSVVPFPINLPSIYCYYVPMDAVFFLTVYDDWGRRKKKYFEELGMNIHILWEVPRSEKGTSGREIRNLMIQDITWQNLVPDIVAEILMKWRIRERIIKLNEENMKGRH